MDAERMNAEEEFCRVAKMEVRIDALEAENAELRQRAEMAEMIVRCVRWVATHYEPRCAEERDLFEEALAAAREQ